MTSVEFTPYDAAAYTISVEETRMDAARAPQSHEEAGTTLSDRDRRILEFERQWWKYAGAKEQAIRDLFEMSGTRYYQILNGLIDDPHVANDIVTSGKADMVALARAMLADPRWPWRAAAALGAPMHHVAQYARSAPLITKWATQEARATAA